MTLVALIILGVLVGLVVLILLIPVGFDAGYEQGELHASAKVMGILLQLYPKPPPDPDKPPKEKKPKKEKKKKEPAEGEQAPKKKRKLNFNRDELLELLRAALNGVGRFGRKIKVDRFVLHFVAAGDDPYSTAMTYGYVNAALSSLAPLCRKRFAVRDCDVYTDVDFTAESLYLDFGLAMSIRVGQVLGVVLGIGFKALGILLRNKRRLKREAAQNPAPPEPGPEETAVSAQDALKETAKETQTEATDEKTDQPIAIEERKDSNGDK